MAISVLHPPTVRLLRDAPRAAHERLALCPVRRLSPGEVLIEPGSVATGLYVVLQGSLAVHIDSLEQESVATVNAGQHCGDVALVDGLPRSAWVVALQGAHVLEVSKQVFWELVTRWPEVAVNALTSMAGQVRGGNQEVRDSRKLQAKYRRHASFDPLTGLYNRRWLAELLPRHVARAHGGEALSAVMVDIDHFKQFNDTYGHAAGDYVLFAVGKRLQSFFRPTDLVARYGGEEFTVILPHTRGEDARRAADRVREALSNEPLCLDCGTDVQVTVSMGVAELMPGQDHAQLLKSADVALYQAKEAGRDRVVLVGEELAA